MAKPTIDAINAAFPLSTSIKKAMIINELPIQNSKTTCYYLSSCQLKKLCLVLYQWRIAAALFLIDIITLLLLSSIVNQLHHNYLYGSFDEQSFDKYATLGHLHLRQHLEHVQEDGPEHFEIFEPKLKQSLRIIFFTGKPKFRNAIPFALDRFGRLNSDLASF